MDLLPRHLEGPLQRAATRVPIVTLTGPRQSGKTTLVRKSFPQKPYLSLEDPDNREFATKDPRGFLARFPDGAIFDEVQQCPDLFSYLQTEVDREGKPGLFVLSGSQNFLLLERVSQSLAGRTRILHLLPFSWSELLDRPLLNLEDLGTTLPAKSRHTDHDAFEIISRGFYPRAQETPSEARLWYRDYYRTYIERDVRALTNVGDLVQFSQFVRLCAGRSGQVLDLSGLGQDCGVSHTTARRWLSMLVTSFLVVLLHPHHGNYRKRLVKRPKMYMLDTGLLTYLLGIRSADELRTHHSRGAIFETFVIAEMIKSAVHRGEEPELSFYGETSRKREVDLVIESAHPPVAVEIKSSQTIASDFFAGLKSWRTLRQDPDAPAALIYGGKESYRREGISVYAWSCL